MIRPAPPYVFVALVGHLLLLAAVFAASTVEGIRLTAVLLVASAIAIGGRLAWVMTGRLAVDDDGLTATNLGRTRWTVAPEQPRRLVIRTSFPRGALPVRTLEVHTGTGDGRRVNGMSIDRSRAIRLSEAIGVPVIWAEDAVWPLPGRSLIHHPSVTGEPPDRVPWRPTEDRRRGDPCTDQPDERAGSRSGPAGRSASSNGARRLASRIAAERRAAETRRPRS